jgi:hypothetical protein
VIKTLATKLQPLGCNFSPTASVKIFGEAFLKKLWEERSGGNAYRKLSSSSYLTMTVTHGFYPLVG